MKHKCVICGDEAEYKQDGQWYCIVCSNVEEDKNESQKSP